MLAPRTDTVLADTARLTRTLEDVLQGHFHQHRAITGLNRRMADYRSSFHLEDIDLRFDDGATLSLVFKNLGQPFGDALLAKPAFLYDPRREIDVYCEILTAEGLGTPACYGARVSGADRQFWLFLERVDGAQLREVGEFSTWELAARWLAAFHRTHADLAGPLAARRRYLTYDAEYFRLWMHRALRLAAADPPVLEGLHHVASRYDEIVSRLAKLPPTFVHGEFYATNVMIRDTASGPVVCPVDWEMGGVGPGLLDLAALAAGWSDDKTGALARAYYDVAAPDGAWGSRDEFMHDFDCCRLHLSVQWLGWSGDWSPPAEHQQDWLGTALHLADRLHH